MNRDELRAKYGNALDTGPNMDDELALAAARAGGLAPSQAPGLAELFRVVRLNERTNGQLAMLAEGVPSATMRRVFERLEYAVPLYSGAPDSSQAQTRESDSARGHIDRNAAAVATRSSDDGSG